MKKVIVLLAMLTFGCKKDNKEPEPTPEPVKVLQKQKVGVLLQNSCPQYEVSMKLSYSGKDTVINQKSFFVWFEDSIKSETIKVEPISINCGTNKLELYLSGQIVSTYTNVTFPVTHTLQ